MGDTQSKRPVKILTTPQDYGGVCWYRLKTFAKAAKKANLASVEAMDAELSDPQIEAMFSSCDALHVRFLNERIANIIRQFKLHYPNKPIVFDTDDDLHNTSPLNNAYKQFGTAEVNLKDGTALWQHGRGEFDLYRNRHRMIDYEYCLAESDAVITTTNRLAGCLKEYNEAVVVIPNGIDFSFWPQLDITRTNKKEVRLVWQGGASHYEDLAMIKEGLKTLMTRYPQLTLVIVGQHFKGITKDLPQDRIETWGWLRADGHGYRMACVDGDIGLAPLRSNDFNANKSCLKWYEYSALRMATVASDTPPYSDEMVDDENGLLFATPDEMVEKVGSLIEDPLRRVDLANKAHDWVKDHRDIDQLVVDWVEFFEKLVETKKGKKPAKKHDLLK